MSQVDDSGKVHGDIDFKLVVFNTLDGLMTRAREGKSITGGVLALYAVLLPLVEHRLEQKKDHAQTFTKRWNELNGKYRARAISLKQYRLKQLSSLIGFIERDGWLFHTRKSYTLDELEAKG